MIFTLGSGHDESFVWFELKFAMGGRENEFPYRRGSGGPENIRKPEQSKKQNQSDSYLRNLDKS